MLRLTWTDFFLRNIPEMLITVKGISIITRKNLSVSKYIFSSITLSLLIFFVRWLPIYFGVHTVINVFLTISLMSIIGVPLIKGMYSTFIMYFMLSLSEFLNIMILQLLNIDTSITLTNPFIKNIYYSPSLLFFLLLIAITNYLLKMKEGVRNVSN